MSEATLSRDLGDFLIDLSITLGKHAIYPAGHPLLGAAVDNLANNLAVLLNARASLSLGIARKQLIIEGVATDPGNPVLRELAQRLHKHHIGAIKFVQGIQRDELANALSAIAVDATRSETPLGLKADGASGQWPHLRVFPLTYDRLQLIEDPDGKPPASSEGRGSSRAAQLWVGLARAALVGESAQHPLTPAEEDQSLEPASVAKAIDAHEHEQAYDQVIVGYMLQIGDELKTAEGAEASGLRKRVSRLVGSLTAPTLERLMEMGGDSVQRRKFLLDASQGITVEAVVDLVKAASASEGQNVSHSMLRMLTKLAHHPSSGSAQKGKSDPMVRDVMRSLVQGWSLDDPNPEGYRAVLETMSQSGGTNGDAPALMVESDRIVQMAIEVRAMGPQVEKAITDMVSAGRTENLLDLVEKAPDAEAALPVWGFIAKQGIFDSLLAAERVNFRLVERFVQRLGLAATPALVDALVAAPTRKSREFFSDLLQSLGASVAPIVAERVADAPPAVQRMLLALIRRVKNVPRGFSPRPYARHTEPLVRREAVKLMLRDPATRGAALISALDDPDDRVVFLALAAAQEKCPPEALNRIKHRVTRGELDSQLRIMGIRIVAQFRTPENLKWLIGRVIRRSAVLRKPILRAPSPEMLAALSCIAADWRGDPRVARVFELASESRDPEVRARLAPGRRMTTLNVVLADE